MKTNDGKTKTTHTPGPLLIFLEGMEKGFGADACKAKNLLEAAPDLLAVAKEALDALYHAEDSMEPLRDSLRNAIRKAEGK